MNQPLRREFLKYLELLYLGRVETDSALFLHETNLPSTRAEEASSKRGSSESGLDFLISAQVATDDVSQIDKALHEAAAAGLRPETPCVEKALAAKQQLHSDAAATTLQGVRRGALAKQRVASIKGMEERRVDAIAKLNLATAGACAALEAARGARVEEPSFPKVLDHVTQAIALLDEIKSEAASAEAPASAAAALEAPAVEVAEAPAASLGFEPAEG